MPVRVCVSACECVPVSMRVSATIFNIADTKVSLPRIVLCARALKLNVVISRHLYTAQDSPTAAHTDSNYTHSHTSTPTYTHVAHNHCAVDSQQSAMSAYVGLAEFVFGCKHKKITEKEMNASRIIQWNEIHKRQPLIQSSFAHTHTGTHIHTLNES